MTRNYGLALGLLATVLVISAAPLPGQSLAPNNRTLPAASPRLPTSTGIGLCQCLGDRERMIFSCLATAAACQSTCGQAYSFVPNAICSLNQPLR